MTSISHMFHSASMLEPAPGFVGRFEARLAYREEQRRRAMVWLLLGIGVVALALLALPSLIGVLRFTGYLVLPYETIVYIQNLLNWVYIVLDAFFESAWVLVRYLCKGPAWPTCAALATGAGALVAIWFRFLAGRLAQERAR
jgi:hypothetical protein